MPGAAPVPPPMGQPVAYLETRVVPRAGVLGTRIAQADDQIRRSRFFGAAPKAPEPAHVAIDLGRGGGRQGGERIGHGVPLLQ